MERPPNFRKAAPGSTEICHTCTYADTVKGVCKRYDVAPGVPYPIERRDTCDTWTEKK